MVQALALDSLASLWNRQTSCLAILSLLYSIFGEPDFWYLQVCFCVPFFYEHILFAVTAPLIGLLIICFILHFIHAILATWAVLHSNQTSFFPLTTAELTHFIPQCGLHLCYGRSCWLRMC